MAGEPLPTPWLPRSPPSKRGSPTIGLPALGSHSVKSVTEWSTVPWTGWLNDRVMLPSSSPNRMEERRCTWAELCRCCKLIDVESFGSFGIFCLEDLRFCYNETIETRQ